jgi:hypothetical protein
VLPNSLSETDNSERAANNPNRCPGFPKHLKPMNTNPSDSLCHSLCKRFSAIVLISFGTFGAFATAHSQSVLAPPEQLSYLPPSARAASAATSSPASAPAATALASPFQWGALAAHPRVSYFYRYGDGIQPRPGLQKKTSVHGLSAGIQMDMGSHWIIDYAPTWTYYSDDSFKDTVDHAAKLVGETSYDDWVLKFDQSFSTSTPPLIETGRQTKQTSYSTSFDAAYRFGNQLQLDTAIAQRTRTAETFPDTRDWSMDNALHFQLANNVDAAVSFGLGYVERSVGANMTYLRPQLQVTWQVSEKLSVSARGGTEKRVIHSGSFDLNNSIADFSLDYRPFEASRLTVSAGRDVAASLFRDQVTESENWNVSLEQRLLGRFFLNARYGRQTASFVATSTAATAGRDDTRSTFSIRLNTTLLQRANIAVVFNESKNESNLGLFGFNSSQIGFEVAYRY